MSNHSKWMILISVFLAFSIFNLVYASPQESYFIYQDGYWYDDWGYTRNYAWGLNGFMPNLAYESLGDWQDVAFDWGTQFLELYPDKIMRAEKILKFIQVWTEYGYDEDNVVMSGEPQGEWAWNADDMGSKIDFDTNSYAIGDCEDLAFLCSTIYQGAAFDTAMVLTDDHAALVIWLPDYPNVLKWDIMGDGRDYGWIWVESTGENNPLGWTPESYRNGDWEAFVIEHMYIKDIEFIPDNPSEEDDVIVTAKILAKTSDLENIVLTYSHTGATDHLIMEFVGDSEYRASIPKQEEGTLVEFKIEVTDTLGNGKESDPLSYQIGEEGFKIPDFLSNTTGIIVVIAVLILIFALL